MLQHWHHDVMFLVSDSGSRVYDSSCPLHPQGDAHALHLHLVSVLSNKTLACSQGGQTAVNF